MTTIISLENLLTTFLFTTFFPVASFVASYQLESLGVGLIIWREAGHDSKQSNLDVCFPLTDGKQTRKNWVSDVVETRWTLLLSYITW